MTKEGTMARLKQRDLFGQWFHGRINHTMAITRRPILLPAVKPVSLRSSKCYIGIVSLIRYE